MSKLSLPTIREALSALRPLGSIERAFLLLDHIHPVHFAITVEVSGRTTVDDWRKALNCVQQRHPLLSMRVEGAPRGVPWFRQTENAPIPLRVLYGHPQAMWAAEVCEELTRPIDANDPPLIRAVLIHAPDRATLSLVAHHSIADGMAVAYLLRDTLDALSNGRLDKLPLVPGMEEIFRTSRSSREPEGEEVTEAGAPNGPPAVWRAQYDAGRRIRALRLTRALTASLQDRAREEATTVHGALCAALVIAGRRDLVPKWRDIPVRIMSPVNARRVLGVGEDCGVFVGAATAVANPDQTDFWDIARKTRADVVPGQSRGSVAAFISQTEQLLESEPDDAAVAGFAAVGLAGEAVITNLGLLPFAAKYDPVEVQAIWGPCVPRNFEDDHVIGVATVNGALCLTHTSRFPRDGLLETMEEVLTEACSVPQPA
jgi:phthiocerol/phthiodiolone dimycocerosyl transferase-like enzyme/condensation domain-containing protein